MSGKDLSVISKEKKIIPHIVEASMGMDRLLFSIIHNSVVEDKERVQLAEAEREGRAYSYAVLRFRMTTSS